MRLGLQCVEYDIYRLKFKLLVLPFVSCFCFVAVKCRKERKEESVGLETNYFRLDLISVIKLIHLERFHSRKSTLHFHLVF